MDSNVRYTVSANDLLSPQLRTMDGNAKALESTISGLGNVITAAFSVYAIQGFISKVIDAGTTVENALTGLTTLIGNEADAQAVITNTMKDAASTPFAFEGLLSANKALIGAGVNAGSAREDVLNLANAIAATGGGDNELQRMVVNMQQISNTGKATAMDIKQFAFAGINIYKVLADATGQPIAKVKEMEISYDLLTSALAKAHGEGGIYYNGLENMAGNTSVKISAVGDAVFQFMNDVFVKSKPLIDATINTAMGFIEVAASIVKWTDTHAAAASALGAAIGVVISGMVLYTTYQKGMAIWTAFTTTSVIAQTFSMAALTAGFAGASVGGMILAGVMAVLNSLNPFAWVVLAVAALAAGMVYLYNKFGQVRGVMQGAWNVIKTYVGIWVDIFKGLGDIIIGVFTLDIDQITDGFNKVTDAALNSGKRLKDAATSGYEEGMTDFKRDKYLESAMGVVGKINEEVEKNTDKSVKHALDLTAKVKADLAKQVASGFITQDDEKNILGKIRKPVKAATGNTGAPGADAKDKTKGVSGPKVVNINVNIGNLIKEFQIKTTNITQGAEGMKKIITEALASAINDAQIISND